MSNRLLDSLNIDYDNDYHNYYGYDYIHVRNMSKCDKQCWIRGKTTPCNWKQKTVPIQGDIYTIKLTDTIDKNVHLSVNVQNGESALFDFFEQHHARFGIYDKNKWMFKEHDVIMKISVCDGNFYGNVHHINC